MSLRKTVRKKEYRKGNRRGRVGRLRKKSFYYQKQSSFLNVISLAFLFLVWWSFQSFYAWVEVGVDGCVWIFNRNSCWMTLRDGPISCTCFSLPVHWILTISRQNSRVLQDLFTQSPWLESSIASLFIYKPYRGGKKAYENTFSKNIKNCIL